MSRDSLKEKKGEKERQREKAQGWLSRRQNISLVPYDGAGLGVWVGVDLIFINISRVAHAQRAASLPTNLRGPHVETDRGSEKRNERGKKRKRDER